MLYSNTKCLGQRSESGNKRPSEQPPAAHAPIAVLRPFAAVYFLASLSLSLLSLSLSLSLLSLNLSLSLFSLTFFLFPTRRFLVALTVSLSLSYWGPRVPMPPPF